jgi:hypothetical protein
MALNTLNDIRTKVRRLTRSISESQLSTNELDNYINTFVLYDLPEHLRTFNLRTQFTFITNPYQDTYATDEVSFAGAITNPLYNFQNKYLTIHPPIYIAGYEVWFSQSREQFFGQYPIINFIQQVETGDGLTTTFLGTIPNSSGVSTLQRQILFNSVDTFGNILALVDVPVVDPATGYNTQFGNLYIPGTEPTTPPVGIILGNNVNYATGQYTITFNTAPAAGKAINAQVVQMPLARPMALLYYDNKFTVRPVPDQAYRVNFEVYIRPVELLQAAQKPELEEWWQYIAYGASKKIFEDRMDIDSVSMIMPEFKKQESLCLRRTIVQNTNERTATIYTEQTSYGAGSRWGFGQF